MINFYDVYRLILLAIAIGSLVTVFWQVFQYKKYYDRLPIFIRKYFSKHSNQIAINQLQNHRQDLIHNAILLIIVLGLNLILWLI